ncbi:MAG: hypothetical protein ACHP9Z_20350, partial [Streptosporangiales bacterium]
DGWAAEGAGTQAADEVSGPATDPGPEDGPEPSTDLGVPADQADEGAESVPSPRPAHDETVPPRPRPDAVAAARVFDAATTRRRSVVFEEDDELDVPDFLK